MVVRIRVEYDNPFQLAMNAGHGKFDSPLNCRRFEIELALIRLCLGIASL